MPRKSMGKWIDDVSKSVGKNIDLETVDGLVRQGKITGFTTSQLKFNGEVVEIIEEVELNNDAMDRIPFNRLASMEIY